MLGTTGQREVELAEELRLKPDSFATVVGQLLSDSSQAAEFLLVVDQFEEIFTLVADDARAAFLGLIETAVGIPQVRVLATIRADFTANVVEMPALAQLFQGRGIFLLSAPGVLALTEMIRRPARVAGCEIRDDLCDRILQDTGTGAGALALMAFALLVVGILGVDILLRSKEMNWNVLRIWTMAQFGLYRGPAMAQIPGGTFQMGSSDCAADDSANWCPQRKVAIQSFEIGQYEVTYDEYSAFVLDRDDIELPPPRQGWGRGSRPVINVSWRDAKSYATWLTEVTGIIYRLPTEAEWEYAVRAGTKTAFSFEGDISNLDQYAWYSDNSENQTHPVGKKKPNDWGLYDMHGHVWEWVEDDWHDNYKGGTG